MFRSFCLLSTGVLAFLGVCCGCNAPTAVLLPELEERHDEDSPHIELMDALLNTHRDMTFEELEKHLGQPVGRLEQLSFDPLESEYFDHIKSKLKLTEDELRLFRDNGFVSVDHQQRYSFGAAYYQIYSAHLPIFVTSDSILHAMHRSFDDLLAELEMSTIAPALQSILQATHQSLSEEHPDGLQDNYRDVDLFLCVARNLLAQGFLKDRKKTTAQSLLVPSRFDQDVAVMEILRLIGETKIQIPGDNSTSLYGGNRPIDFSQFIARGHYNKNKRLKAYFRCMMWLSRADCGWFVQPADPVTTIVNDAERELINACLLAISLRDSGQFENFESLNRLLSHFASQDDNLSVHTLDALLMENAIREPADLVDRDRIARIFEVIGEAGLATQMIRSQAILVDGVSYTVPPPSLFQFFGQKFVIDSFVLSNVVYDSIIFEDAKVRRYMPKGLDVMAALGNDEAVRLLEPELRQHRYSTNLFAASRFVDACTKEFWSRDLYNVWLDSIRELDKDITTLEHVPDFMKTNVWQKKQLQTQLGSWSELRHDMVLYAKQSYTGTPGCEYPAGYVEPYPEFYGKLRSFTESLRTALLDFQHAEKLMATSKSAAQKADLLEKHNKRIAYTARVIKVLNQLESIARFELDGIELTSEQTLFLQKSINRRGSLRHGSGQKPNYDGWYCDLFYTRDDVKKWDPAIIDVHTFPDSQGEPLVLEVGVGDVNLGVFAVNCGEKATAYVGPLYSYYEFHQPANERLTDVTWARMIGGDKAAMFHLPGKKQTVTVPEMPSRPEWTRAFQGQPQRRTIGNISVNVFNSAIKVVYTKDNQAPTTKSFPATNQGVKSFVDFVLEKKFTDRLTLYLIAENITPECLNDLQRLDGLAFLSLGGSSDDPALDRFRSNRPDVELWPAALRLMRADICSSVAGFQTFTSVPDRQVVHGAALKIYIELEGLRVESRLFGERNRTAVKINMQVVDEHGQTLQEKMYPNLDETVKEYPISFYRAPEFQIDADIPAGEYLLKLQVKDNLNPSGPTVATSLPFEVCAATESKR